MTEFKLIVAGGRDFNNYELLAEKLLDVMDKKPSISIVSGMARGADALGVYFAKEHGLKVYPFPAHWNLHGNAAGPIRNRQMAEFADGLLAFWDGKSSGTKHMIEYMQSLNKPVEIVRYVLFNMTAVAKIPTYQD